MVGMFGGVKLGGGARGWRQVGDAGRFVELELENFEQRALVHTYIT